MRSYIAWSKVTSAPHPGGGSAGNVGRVVDVHCYVDGQLPSSGYPEGFTIGPVDWVGPLQPGSGPAPGMKAPGAATVIASGE